jgi:DNA-binding transcriptional LysR family regulator
MSDINFSNRKLGQNLPGLFVFDLVSRHGNFTGAATSLGLTQSSISQRIKTLEIELGVVLFKREHRGVTLTNEGLRLYNVVSPAMLQIGNSVTTLLERKSKPRVRISADFSFSTFWLLPRLSDLRSELDDEIEIQILASQTRPSDGDDGCDIQIHISPLSKLVDGDVLLLKEKVAAVCSPSFIEKNGPISSSKELLKTQLLSLSKPPSAYWINWQDWFDSLGISGSRSQNYISFNNYDMVTQSAVAGDGIALGWLGLIDELLQKKQLIQITDDVVTSESGYVMSRDKSNLSSGPQRVFDWIADQTNDMA